LPLRLDAYSKCQFGCRYCFASARGGNRGPGRIRLAQPESLARHLDGVQVRAPRSVVEEFLAQRQPIHFGGMSDPFPPSERAQRVSLRYLEILSRHAYPTIVSTKSDLVSDDAYLRLITKGTYLVQFSASSLDPKLTAQVEPGTPGPQRLLAAMRILRDAGVPTALRIQPLLPQREGDAKELLQAAVENGARHVAVEHLKVPIELSWRGSAPMRRALGFDVANLYRYRKALRVGREWLLRPEDRIAMILDFRSLSWRLGTSFGAADTDLLALGDGLCCCSGADQLMGFGKFFRRTYSEAIKAGINDGIVSRGRIADLWSPSGTIARFVNSHSRLPPVRSKAPGISAYIDDHWNGSQHGSSPGNFFGVRPTTQLDNGGYRIYELSSEMRELMRPTRRFV
jgi:DNA repair photolyase